MGMTEREKLIRIIEEEDDGGPDCYECKTPVGRCHRCVNEWHADYLIANGVRLETNQATSDKASEENKRWIPVTERLPEDELDRVLIASDFDSPVGNQKIDTDRFRRGSWVRYGDHVTHWMPLPEPPKEDE